MGPAIEDLSAHIGETVSLSGWLHNRRASKGLAFLVVRDGSGIVQCVVNEENVSAESWASASTIAQESSLSLTGVVKRHERQVGGVEVEVSDLSVIGSSDDYPITPKSHGTEFLMNNRHLWLRSRRQWAVMRVRNRVIMSIHELFQGKGFVQMDAPILTGNAVEGTSTLFEMDYFGQPAYLTQSGQLYGEAMAMAMGKIYTFGPTFRAEKSKTRRHLTEFWMIEPEMAFYDLADAMQLAEELLVHIAQRVLETCTVELGVLERDTAALASITGPFPRLSYSEAVDLLKSEKTLELIDQRIASAEEGLVALQAELDENKARYGQAKKGEKRRIDAREIQINAEVEGLTEALRNLPKWRESATSFEWGSDLGGSDETVVTWHFDRPIIVHRYPAAVKAFYMKRDPDDDRLALGMDVLAPEGYGEVIGGGERATDLEFLKHQVQDHGLPEEVFQWYFDLRRYGSVPHSGFGLGLERTVAWMCGLQHLRESIPFPRLLGRLNP